jgi:hypothetical protein
MHYHVLFKSSDDVPWLYFRVLVVIPELLRCAPETGLSNLNLTELFPQLPRPVSGPKFTDYFVKTADQFHVTYYMVTNISDPELLFLFTSGPHKGYHAPFRSNVLHCNLRY